MTFDPDQMFHNEPLDPVICETLDELGVNRRTDYNLREKGTLEISLIKNRKQKLI